MKKTAFALFVFFLALIATSRANAMALPTYVDLDTISGVSFGFVDAYEEMGTGDDKDYQLDRFIGSLAPMTSVVFTYLVPQSYSNNDSLIGAFETPAPGLIVTPSFTTGAYSGTMTFMNFSAIAANIAGYFFRDVADLDGRDPSTVYVSAPISNVPLPAALPLFGLGLLGLAGYRRMKKA